MSRKDITELNRKAKRQDFDEIVLTHYLTPYLLHEEFEQRQSLTPETKTIIFGVIDQLNTFLTKEGHELFRNGKLSACGSVPEDTKVGKHDEFDYQFLITLGRYVATRKVHPRTRPRHESTSHKLGAKSFYELKMVRENGDDIKLLAENTQDRFMENVCQAISQLDIEYTVKKAGPAVKLVFTHPDIEYCVKIDLTLGIEAEVLNVFKECELTSLGVELLHESKLQCHFVSSTDYWKICFLRTEQTIMLGLPNSCIKCYTIMKSLRDEVDVKDLYGDGILQTYPLKVTFMDLALTDTKAGRKWTEQDTGKNVNRVLREVEHRGQRHEICSIFVKDEEVMGESDRSYLESTRILNELTRLHDTYLREKSVLPYTCMLFIGILSFIIHLLEYVNINSPLHPRNSHSSNRICSVTANLHRYTNASNLWEDILIGEYNLTFLLYILETVCVVIFAFQFFNESIKIKGHFDLFPNSSVFIGVLAVLHIRSALFFMKLSFRNANEFEFYSRKLRLAMQMCQLATVFPVMQALVQISIKALLSVILPINTLFFMESFFHQLKVDYNVFIIYIKDVRDYFAEGAPRKQQEKIYLLPILLSSVLLFVLEIFVYIYIWNEEDDISFLLVRAEEFAFFSMASFATQYRGFYLRSRFVFESLLIMPPGLKQPASSFVSAAMPYAICIITLFILAWQWNLTHLHLDLLMIGLQFIYLLINAIKCKDHKIFYGPQTYQWIISSLIVLCGYHSTKWLYYRLEVFADFLKYNHFSIIATHQLSHIMIIGLISILSTMSFGMAIWVCWRSDEFRKYTVKLLKIKIQKYAEFIKSIAAKIIGFAVIIFILYDFYAS